MSSRGLRVVAIISNKLVKTGSLRQIFPSLLESSKIMFYFVEIWGVLWQKLDDVTLLVGEFPYPAFAVNRSIIHD